jgi:DHA1 family bicyclomycin/chloramphenicol resistance-like MFS transporter
MLENSADVATQNLFIGSLGLLIATSAFAIDICLPAIPLIAQHFSVQEVSAQWVVTAYLLGFAFGQIPLGLAADRFGRRRVIFACLSGYVVTSVAAAIAPSMCVLIFARLMQGACGSVGGVTARAIVRDIGGQNGAALMALMTAILGLAPLLSPLLGGLLAERFGWESTFYAISIYGALTLFLVWRVVPETLSERSDATPLVQIKTSVRGLFSDWRGVAALFLVCTPFAGYLAMITSASTVLINHYGLSPATFGLVFALAAAAYSGGAFLARMILPHVPQKTVLKLGVIVIGAAGGLLFMVLAHQSPPLWFLWGAVMVFILGLSITAPIATILTLEPLPGSAGFAASVIGAFQIGFGAIGSLISVRHFNGSEYSMTLVMLASAIATVIIYLIWNCLDRRISAASGG